MGKNILFILSVPPPYGGGEILNKMIYDSLKNKYNFFLFKRKKHSKSKQSRNSISDIIYGISYIACSLFYILKYKPKKLFIGLPKTFPPFFRNSIVIHFANFFNIEITAVLHGMNFLFLNNKILYKYYKFTINRISKIIILSNSIKKYIRCTGYKNSLYIIDNGFDVPIILRKINKKKLSTIRLLYFGAISKSKGFGRVLKILSYLKRNSKIKFTLNVVGEWVRKSFKYECEKYICNNKLESNIIFKGHLHDYKRWKVISQNHIMLHMTKYDGQPLTIIETMGLGIPTIATKVGAIPEMITDGYDGFLVDNYLNDTIRILDKIICGNLNYYIVSNNAIKTYNKRFRAKEHILNIENVLKQ